MRFMQLAAALGVTVASAALAQQPASVHKPKSKVEKPIDKGPYTPAANGAYQGGGVVLQGAPGAPAPRPKATPPGQMPQGAVLK